MARYIDGDRAVELIAILIEADKLGELTAVSDARLNECKNHKYGLLSAYRSIEQVPTADVEEVVYCNECIFRYTETCFAKHETADMDFCSCGAKIDGGKITDGSSN